MCPPNSWNSRETPWKRIKQLLKGDTVYRAVLQIYWATLGSAKSKTAIRWTQTYCNIPRSYQKLFHKSFLRSKTYAVYAGLAEATETDQTMGSDYYLKNRAKRHFAYMSRSLNISCGAFDPLYDPVILATAAALPEAERANGRLSFDLMEALGGRALLEIPFVEKSISPDQLLYLSKRLSLPVEKLSRQPINLAALPQRKIKTAVGQNLSLSNTPAPKGLCDHGVYLWNIRSYFVDLLETLPVTHNFWDIFNRKYLLDATAPHGYFFRNSTTATRGLRIFHTLLWVAREEQHFPINTRI